MQNLEIFTTNRFSGRKKLEKIFRVTDSPEHDFANLIENEPNMNLTGGG